MRSLLNAWDRSWFRPAEPLDLGVTRALYFGLMLVYYMPFDFAGWGDVPGELWEPVGIIRRILPEQPSRELLGAIGAGWKVALLLACLGVATRPSTLAAFALGIVTIGIKQCFGKVSHADGLIVITLAILAMSRCGDAISIDAWLARWRGRRPPAVSGEYRWPIRAVWLAMALVFFSSGISKLRHGGIDWFLSDNLSLKLVTFTIPGRGDGSMQLAELLSRQPGLCKVAATTTLIVELSMILTPFSRRARAVVVPTMFAMQVGMGAAMLGPVFLAFSFSYLFWIPWSAILDWRRGAGKAIDSPDSTPRGPGPSPP